MITIESSCVRRAPQNEIHGTAADVGIRRLRRSFVKSARHKPIPAGRWDRAAVASNELEQGKHGAGDKSRDGARFFTRGFIIFLRRPRSFRHILSRERVAKWSVTDGCAPQYIYTHV